LSSGFDLGPKLALRVTALCRSGGPAIGLLLQAGCPEMEIYSGWMGQFLAMALTI